MIKTKRVASRLYFLVAFMATTMIIMGVVGITNMSKVLDSLETVYNDRTIPTGELSRIQALLNGSFSEVLRALQHNPAYEISRLHDHPVSEHVNRVEKSLANMKELWAKYMATYLTPEEKVLAEQYDKQSARYIAEVLNPALDALRKGDYSIGMTERFLKGNRSIGGDAEKTMSQLVELQMRVAAEEYGKGEAKFHFARKMAMIFISLALIFGLSLAFWIIRSITTPLREVQATIAVVERDSDFTRRVDVDSHDEVGEMSKSFNQLIATMRETARSVLENVARVSDSVGGLAASSSQVASSSAQQSEAASAMAASVEQMTVSISHVSDSAQDALALSRKSGELSAQGGEVIHRAVDEMNQIAGTVRQASAAIDSLGQQSDQITSVVQVIKEVADQTNLLALNAAIEAARAGEQGRGFAVVADEVRKLAERTTKATEEIAAMVNSIQESARSAVTTMDNAVERVGSGATLAQQAGEAINQIRSGAEQVVHVVNDITSALAEQSVASNDIASHVERVAQMTEENSAAAGEAARSAEHLQQLAGEMRSAVSRFKI